MNEVNRRSFFKLMGKSSMAIALSWYMMPVKLSADDNNDDFKALVVVQMMGGVDSFNMFIPTDMTDGCTTGYELYAKARSSETQVLRNDKMSELRAKRVDDKFLDLSVDGNFYMVEGGEAAETNDDGNKIDENGEEILDDGEVTEVGETGLEDIYVGSLYIQQDEDFEGKGIDGTSFDGKIGTHGVMPELANLLDIGQGAVIQNVGNIEKPYTKADFQRDKSLYPPSLGAHNQQENLTQTGQAKTINFSTGWLGRAADVLNRNGEVNSSVYGMNLNLSRFGNNKMLFGNHTDGFSYSFQGPSAFGAISKTTYSKLLDVSKRDMFKKLFTDTHKSVHDNIEGLVADWENINGDGDPFVGLTDSYGNPFSEVTASNKHNLGSGISHKMVESLTTAAKLIEMARKSGQKRAVIGLSMGGLDTHASSYRAHLNAYRGLSIGLDKFTRAMDHLGISDKVTTFNISEFGRNLATNGPGTGHGWGASFFAVGGAVKPGNYGTFPDLTLGGPDDKRSGGTLIPSTSVTQYYATIIRWFGVPEADMDYVLPDLKHFAVKDLGFMGDA